MDMLKSKTIDRICCYALVLMLVLTCAVWASKASAGLKQTVAVGYEGLFDQSVVHTIDIEMDDCPPWPPWAARNIPSRSNSISL